MFKMIVFVQERFFFKGIKVSLFYYYYYFFFTGDKEDSNT